ncbi:MAG: transcriptional repressor LexA [Alphaproteobacteria bacterium]|nr:MAG: transcriptional repressor LexA [Alphaproteobacteria bacterium]
MLTSKQHSLLVYIDDYIKENGVCPSFEEMMKAIKLRSKSGVHRLIMALEERGFLRRLPNRARALEVVKLPMADQKEDKSKKKNVLAAYASLVQVPLLGKIAAGNPIEAIENANSNIDVPPSLLGRGQHYALMVEGDSMIDEGIYDGDIAIIQYVHTAENGQIVVALVDEEDVTLKTLQRRKNDMIDLIPANDAHKTQTYHSKQVKVQGVLKGLLRRY